jgi:hypothetical protein
MSVEITTAAFRAGATIPKKYTADGEDRSPPLAWSSPPAGSKSIALICDDPDAPRGTWVHWVLFNLPGETRHLEEGVPNRQFHRHKRTAAMLRATVLALLAATICLAGCDSGKHPDDGHVNAKAKAGMAGPVPFAFVELEIKGLDIIAAKAIDWVKGIITYVMGGEEQRLELTAEQLADLKQGETATSQTADGKTVSITPKK